MTPETSTIRFEGVHVAAVRRALDSLKADQQLLERWSCHSVQLGLEIDDLEELLDRMTTSIGARRALEAVS